MYKTTRAAKNNECITTIGLFPLQIHINILSSIFRRFSEDGNKNIKQVFPHLISIFQNIPTKGNFATHI